jgi:dihydroflavonol-4-reductase
MQAFVTGSTGLLGGNLVRLLVQQGHTVKALVRNPAKAQRLFNGIDGITFVQGDMEDVAGFAGALRGSDVLFHTAAYFREYYGNGDHWAKLEKINVTGTTELLSAAEDAEVRKAIYVSSSGVIGDAPGNALSDESTGPGAFSRSNLYFRSKVVAEERVYDWLHTHRMPVVLILPTWMYGPYDAAPTGAGKMVQAFLGGDLTALLPGGSMVVDARDVAQAMISAVDCGQNGERYLIGGVPRSIKEIAQTMSTVTGKPAPTLLLPYPLALFLGWASQILARMRNSEALITVEAVRTFQSGYVKVSSAKAIRDLGASFRPFEDTLRDQIAWQKAYFAKR